MAGGLTRHSVVILTGMEFSSMVKEGWNRLKDDSLQIRHIRSTLIVLSRTLSIPILQSL
jgi:hypothetical protein